MQSVKANLESILEEVNKFYENLIKNSLLYCLKLTCNFIYFG